MTVAEPATKHVRVDWQFLLGLVEDAAYADRVVDVASYLEGIADLLGGHDPRAGTLVPLPEGLLVGAAL